MLLRPKERMLSEASRSSSPIEDADAILVRRFIAGDSRAFDEIYDRYKEKVYVIAKGILLNPEDASDAVQETFTLIYNNLPKFGQRSRLSTWIFRIAVNTAIQISRRLKYRSRIRPLEEAEELTKEVEEEKDTSKVYRALATLKPDDRAVLTMFYWENMSLEDIGEALKCGANAAKTRLYRARERFKERYELLEKQSKSEE